MLTTSMLSLQLWLTGLKQLKNTKSTPSETETKPRRNQTRPRLFFKCLSTKIVYILQRWKQTNCSDVYSSSNRVKQILEAENHIWIAYVSQSR